MANATSIVEYFAGNEASRCGYCKGKDTSYSTGMWGHLLTVEDYQNLIDRGWRRSGRYCYKPTMNKTCCPQYTIRSDSLLFQPTKSHKRVIKRFRNYIIKGAEKKEVFTLPPKTFDVYETDGDSSDDTMDQKAFQVQKQLKMNQTGEQNVASGTERVTSDIECEAGPSETCQQKIERKKILKPSDGADPTKPKCRKAKEVRRERALQKLAAKGIDAPSLPPKRQQQQQPSEEKSLQDLLFEPFPENSKHKFEIRIFLAQTSNEEFMKSHEESLQVYRKYQVSVHKDSPSKCSPDQFNRFLCNSSLIFEKQPFVDPRTGEVLAPGYGAFHQQYLIDGKIVCVGVIDILTTCVSSVYLYYDPDYSFLSLGTLSSLFEFVYVRRLAQIRAAVKYYYMGYYIHSCPKMRYKAQYHPSEIVCPLTFQWIPVEKCLPKLDVAKFCRLSETGNAPSTELDLDEVLILYRRQAMPYGVYRELRFPDDDDEEDEEEGRSDTAEVREYALLVGEKVWRRMLLYRS